MSSIEATVFIASAHRNGWPNQSSWIKARGASGDFRLFGKLLRLGRALVIGHSSNRSVAPLPYSIVWSDYSEAVDSASIICARMLFLTARRRYFSLALRVPARYARSRYLLAKLRCMAADSIVRPRDL